MDITAEKKALRRKLLPMLKAMPEDLRRCSDDQIRLAALSMPEFQQANSLFIFIGCDWEVDTWPLIEAALAEGKRVAAPRCLPQKRMEARLIQSRADLERVAPLGLYEPAEAKPLLAPCDIDLALIPCIACDKEGRRLGRGGGYYDRFLRQSRFLRAALCRNAVLRRRLPSQTHDVSMDMIITESGVYRLRDDGAPNIHG